METVAVWNHNRWNIGKREGCFYFDWSQSPSDLLKKKTLRNGFIIYTDSWKSYKTHSIYKTDFKIKVTHNFGKYYNSTGSQYSFNVDNCAVKK